MEKHTFDIDFDLPEVADKRESAQPRVQIAGDVCVSCEG